MIGLNKASLKSAGVEARPPSPSFGGEWMNRAMAWWVDDMFSKMDGRDLFVLTVGILVGICGTLFLGGCL